MTDPAGGEIMVAQALQRERLQLLELNQISRFAAGVRSRRALYGWTLRAQAIAHTRYRLAVRALCDARWNVRRHQEGR